MMGIVKMAAAVDGRSGGVGRKAVSALVPRSATALQKDTAAGRERWEGVAFLFD
jgi:hypothetical protein